MNVLWLLPFNANNVDGHAGGHDKQANKRFDGYLIERHADYKQAHEQKCNRIEEIDLFCCEISIYILGSAMHAPKKATISFRFTLIGLGKFGCVFLNHNRPLTDKAMHKYSASTPKLSRTKTS